jgi:oleate hydratase
MVQWSTAVVYGSKGSAQIKMPGSTVLSVSGLNCAAPSKVERRNRKMSKNKLGAVLGAAAAITAAVAVTKKLQQNSQEQAAEKAARPVEDFHNTERGHDAVNRKGIYYANGNYEAFAKPEKPAGVENKSAWLVGSGLASLAAACFLVRDAQMPGANIHILEALDLPGGSCDGLHDPTKGFVMRGGREMDNHFECMWDLYRSIPSIEKKGVTVLDEYYWLNKHDPNYSLCRATENRGQDAHTDGKFGLSQKGCMEILKLFMSSDEELYDKTIEDVFDDEVLTSNFWLYWRTMFAFENWHSALEMKLYIQRYIHHIAGLPDFSALRFTKYNQYDSMILPMVKYLEKAGVKFQYKTVVSNVKFRKEDGKKIAEQIECTVDGAPQTIPLTENDFVFVTNGSCTEATYYGDQDHAPDLNAPVGGQCWELWRNLAAQDPDFGHPEKFCSDPAKTTWESASILTQDEKILPYIQRICQRDPLSGGVVTGGIISVKDSNWLLSWTINRQPQFKDQPEGKVCVWVYGLFTDVPGNFIRKPMTECTGEEITEEWLYHLGVPEEEIPGLAKNSAVCVPTLMPYITAFFMPRTKGDRPDVIPDGCVNFAFLGQFADTPRDTVFTTEYSIRTGMEAVYGLLHVDRAVPEVYGSVYDVRCLLDASVRLMDGKSPLDIDLGPLNLLKKPLLSVIRHTEVEKLLRRYRILHD